MSASDKDSYDGLPASDLTLFKELDSVIAWCGSRLGTVALVTTLVVLALPVVPVVLLGYGIVRARVFGRGVVQGFREVLGGD